MTSAVGASLLVLCLLNIMEIHCIPVTSAAVGPELTPPSNLTMITLNTNFTLTWDWDYTGNHTEAGAVTFTVEYIGKYQVSKVNADWNTACTGMSHKTCDLTASKLHYLGMYVFRVQASANGRHSKSKLLEFCPDKEAALGPPSKVDLAPAGSGIDVFVSDPLTSDNDSMRSLVAKMYFHIQYWERSAQAQAPRIQTLNSTLNLLTLSDLKAWTWYCLHIQSCEDFYGKSSGFTSPQCIQTEGSTPSWQIILYFLGSLILCLIMLLSLYGVFLCCKTLKSALYPTNQLPTNLEKYLCDSPSSDLPRLLSPDSELELLYDHVIICDGPTKVEFQPLPPEAPSPGLESGSSASHTRQNSDSSGDSGLYSTGGSSNLQQPINSQTSPGSDVCHFDLLEQGKMEKTTLKTQLLITDEGIVDVCV